MAKKHYPNEEYSLSESSRKRNTFHGLIVNILEIEGKPMTRKEIVKKVLLKKHSSGKTPEKTTDTVLQRSSKIIRVTRGIYTLK